MKQSILLLFMIGRLFGQADIKGIVKDSVSKVPIAFASIGLVGKSVGTLSDENGEFELKLTAQFLKDSLKIGAVGYKPISFLVSDLLKLKDSGFFLAPTAKQLEEVVVNSTRTATLILGTKKYTKNNCSGFVKNTANWKGSEAAILAGNKEGRKVMIQSFSFFVIQNKYNDSLRFRLMLYEASAKKWPRMKTLMRKPVIFKVGVKQGEFTLDLRNYNITTDKDFFISLECLVDEIDISKFCFAGSYSTPSFVKPAAFEWWKKVKGGGGDFRVKVSYEQ